MVEAALFIIGDAAISDAEVRIAARYVIRQLAESQELSHLSATYLVALGETPNGQPSESGIAVFPNVDAKLAFDEKINASENVCYTRADFDGFPIIEAERQWSQQDAVVAMMAVLEDVRKMVDGFGLINAVARQFYIAPNVLFTDGPIRTTRDLLDRIEARALETEKQMAAQAAAEAAVEPATNSDGVNG